MELDSDLNYRLQKDIEPLVFSPTVDWDTFSEPNITHAY
jgi:hypothetical protein